MSMDRDHDWGFFLWMLTGFLISFGILGMLSIGLPFFLLGMGALLALAWRGPVWPADLGIIAGVGATCLLIALISALSGDISPYVWAIVGTALIGSSTAVFWQLRCRSISPVR